MENIILELRKGEKENIYGGEGRVVYVLNEEGKCIPRYRQTRPHTDGF